MSDRITREAAIIGGYQTQVLTLDSAIPQATHAPQANPNIVEYAAIQDKLKAYYYQDVQALISVDNDATKLSWSPRDYEVLP